MKLTRFLLSGLAGALLASGAITASVQASPIASPLEPRSLAHAQSIRAQLDARYRVPPGRGLAVTETRFLPADNGIYYAICPVRTTCPYPARRFARPAADLVSRRLALELALRTFLETSADVVAVSLPTPRFIAFIVERTELAREVHMPTLAKALGRDPSRAFSASMAQVVDRVTRPRVFVAMGLEPTPNGRDSWAGVPRWPSRRA
jgi:hypothetical protein